MRTNKTTAALRLLACGCSLAVLSGIVSAQVNPQSEEDMVIKVFSLAHATASETIDVVDAIFGDAAVRIAVDQRTNSLIAKGQENELAAMEALILRLDEEPNRDRTSAPDGTADDQGAKPTRGIELRSEVPGAMVIRKLAPSGATVNEGDVVVELDDSKQIEVLENLKVEMEELRAAEFVTKQEAKADQAEAIKTGEMELKVAELQVKRVKAEMNFERIVIQGEVSLSGKTLETLKAREKQADAMAERGTVSLEQRQAIALEVVKAETTLKVAIAKGELLTEVIQPLKLAEAELDLVRAKANLDLERREAALRSEEARARLVALNAEMARKTDQLTRLEKQISSCRILAPSRGVVRISRPSIIKPGVVVRQGQLLLHLESEASRSAE